MDCSIQLYSVHTAMKEDLKGTLKKLAEMGYTHIEPCGFFGYSADDFKTICDEYGLKVSGAHVDTSFLDDERIDDILKYLKAIGCPRYIIPCSDFSNKTAVDDLITRINKYAPKFKEAGIEFVFHNHSPELLYNNDNQIAHIDIAEKTDIRFQVDVYWVFRAGINVFYFLELYKDRISCLHLKDGTTLIGTPLGRGQLQLDKILKWANGHNIPYVVENDPAGNAEKELAEAKESIDYLKSLI